MRAFLDTNVLLDVLISGRPSYIASRGIINMAIDRKINLGVTSQSIIDTSYVSLKNGVTVETFKKFVTLLSKVAIIDYLDFFDITAAADSQEIDFEDEAQYAHAIRGDYDIMITSDKGLLERHRGETFPVLTPEEFVEKVTC